jgi:hypothetical protein
MGEMSNAYKIYVVKLEGKRLHGRPRHRWKDNIRMDLKEIGWEGVNWMNLDQYRDQRHALENMVMNLWVP